MSTISMKCIPMSSSKLPPSSSSSSRDPTTSIPKSGLIPRRTIFPSLVALVPLLLPQVGIVPASAKDIGLFGVRKRDLERVEREVVEEVKEIVREGEQLVAPSSSDSASDSGLSVRPNPVIQAGTVVGAEIVATLIASSLVSGLIDES